MKYSVIPLRHTIPLLGSSLLILTACTAVSVVSTSSTLSSLASSKEKTVPSVISDKTPQPKHIMDGSEPFTMPEIEERLLRVFALPPAQINKESVAKIFGIVLNGNERPLFFEEISADKQTIFSVTTPAYWPSNPVFDYKTAVKKISKDNGEKYLEDSPREIPEAYKFPYLPFVQKLASFDWQHKGLNSDVGNHSSYFMKDGFLLVVHIDNYQYRANGQPDYAQTRISRIVVNAPIKR